jgi:hypothetical protein
MRDIMILNSKEIECSLVLIYVFTELCDAYTRLGHKVSIITDINDITNNSIVFMGNIFNVKNPVELLYNVAPLAIYIGWYWQKKNVSLLKYFIHIYENILAKKPTLNKILKLNFMKINKNTCPLLLRANDEVDKIGTYIRNEIRDYCYMGYQYCLSLVPSDKFTGIYHGVTDHKLFYTYNKRKEIYLSSTFALGFQSEENIINGHVSQRIYEGLAYGCIVLSNSIWACRETENIVVYISSKKDLEEKMIYYKNNRDKIKEKQKKGYEFIKRVGTNNYAISLINDKIKEITI